MDDVDTSLDETAPTRLKWADLDTETWYCMVSRRATPGVFGDSSAVALCTCHGKMIVTYAGSNIHDRLVIAYEQKPNDKRHVYVRPCRHGRWQPLQPQLRFKCH